MVAREGVVVVGFISAVHYVHPDKAAPEFWLNEVGVASTHRGQGIGRMLLEAALAALRVRGAPRVVLSTAERNESAQRLFARAGFRPTMIEMTREASG